MAKVSDLDDNLEVTVQPEQVNADNVMDEEQKKEFFNTFRDALNAKISDLDLGNYFNSIGTSITAAAEKTVSSSMMAAIPNITNELQDISETFAKGSDKNYEEALDRLQKIVDKTGINLFQFSQQLGNSFDKLRKAFEARKENIEAVNKEREILREKGIQTKVVENQQKKELEIRVLTNRQYREEVKKLERDERLQKDREKQFTKEREKLLREEKLTKRQSESIINKQEKITKSRELLEQRREDLTGQKGEGEKEGGFFRGAGRFLRGETGPEILRPVTATFGQTLMAPMEAFTQLKEQSMMLGRSFKGILKPLGNLSKITTFLSRTLLPIIIAFIGITAAIVGVIALFKKLKTIWPFSLIGGGDETPAEKAEKLAQAEEFTNSEMPMDAFDDGDAPTISSEFQKNERMKNQDGDPTIRTSENYDFIKGEYKPGFKPISSNIDLQPQNLKYMVPEGDAGKSMETILTNIAPNNILNSSKSETMVASSPNNNDRTFNILNGGLEV
tara:strand:+ start:63 stop:1574 length:1512 start_codon:yes stop_codon:yes gene_type:complete